MSSSINKIFPDPRSAGPDGLVAVGGHLDPEILLQAYRQGIFRFPMTWFCPEERAILNFSDLHISKSLRRIQKKKPFVLTVDRAFNRVIKNCATVRRPDQKGSQNSTQHLTWITSDILRAYQEFHELGYAHSVEVWDGERLVGGVYGVDVDGVFSAESMFHLVPNASKLALLRLIGLLDSRGTDWMDIQVMTPHLQALGAKSIPRDQFLKQLAQTQATVHNRIEVFHRGWRDWAALKF